MGKLNFTYGWFFLTISLALHVLDEALNDFLSFYNPLVVQVNAQLSFFRFPTFSFSTWLIGLIIVILILLSLTYYAQKEKSWIVKFSFIYGFLMILNGLGHISYSIYRAETIPGTYSAPLLLIASIYLIASARKIKMS